MCTRYISPEDLDIERHWHIGGRSPWRGAELWPRREGAFIRAAREGGDRELVTGIWSLIPDWAKAKIDKSATYNARWEDLIAGRTRAFAGPWKRAYRCIIPAWAFYEPNWETGVHIPWIFRRADKAPWGLAGLWNGWTDRDTGEVVHSYTMLTVNADDHALMGRMHRPDPKRPVEKQDKRSVVPIELGDVDQWLRGSAEEAAELIHLAPVEVFDGQPALILAASQT